MKSQNNRSGERIPEDRYFRAAIRLAEKYSTCLKIKTGALIVKNGKIVGRGFNLCSPEGFDYGKKFRNCKRLKLPTGQGYKLCKPLHAEVMALIDAGAKNCRGATLYLSGHYYPCWNCEGHARRAGVREVKVKDVGAKNFHRGLSARSSAT